jgi:hypothetical protein
MTFKIKEGISIAGSQLSDGDRNLTAGSLIATGQTSLGGAAGSETVRVNTGTNTGKYTLLSSDAATNTQLVGGVGGTGLVLFSSATNSTRLRTNGAAGNDQMLVAHTASAVNFVQVTGAATSGLPSVSAQGSDASISLQLAAKGGAAVNFATNGVGTATQFSVTHTASSVNHLAATGSGVAGLSPRLFAVGSDTNISQVFQSKGTGAINLAPGSSGVNISNGGTVTAITRTAASSGYTSFPSVAISAPTTAGGVQATAVVGSMVNTGAAVASGGTGYTVGNTLTVLGGTTTGVSATLTVTAVSGGVVTSATPANFGQFTVLPTNPVSVTGGTGSGATFNLNYGVGSNPSFTITNAGSGYVEQPAVSFSGGGGSGAAAYATVGGGAIIRSIGTTGVSAFDFQGSASASNNAPILRLRDVNTGTSSNTGYIQLQNANGYTQLIAQGPSTVHLNIASNGDGRINFNTRSTSEVTQMRVSDTASAVNFVQVTGSATGGRPTLSAQGSDANVGLTFISKGNARTAAFFNNNATSSFQFSVGLSGVTNAVNYLNVNGVAASNSPELTAEGNDTNLNIRLIPKGTGAVVSSSSVVPSVNNASDLGTSALQWREVFATKFTENGSPVVVQTDIGTEPNEIPLNQYLGNLAYQDSSNIAGSLTAGSINNTPIGNTTAATATFTTLTANAGIGSTNTTTGTVIVTGGVGVSQNLNIGGTATAPTFIGALTGNASTATTLQTARTIGGVSFNGAANIDLPGVNTVGNQNTTGSAATLTTARTLTIGSTGKTFNGSANVTWTLAEIGAQAAGNFVTTDTVQTITSTKTIRSSLLYQSPNLSNTISSNMLNGGTLSFEGNTGQLFSITDSMTGTIFSVNDVSGIPSIEVLDTGLVKLAEYSGNVVIGSAVDNGTDKLQVTGSAVVTGQTELGGAGSGAGLRVLPLASSDNPWILTAGRAGVQGNRFSGLSPAIQSTDTGSVFINTSAGTLGGAGANQMRVSHTASAVNYVQVTGAATGGAVAVSAQGSDANIQLTLQSKGAGTVNLIDGTNLTGVRVQRSTVGGDTFLDVQRNSALVELKAASGVTNGAFLVQSKGTGAIDLAAGSSGVNISNGGTVTAITRTTVGSNYTSVPLVAVSAPTTAGGVQATATATMLMASATIASGGTGYTVGNILTAVGAAGPDPNPRVAVTSVSGGVITGISVNNNGVMTTLPTNPFSVTGGSGTGATFNGNFGVSGFTITNAGSGYVEQPTVSFSGGGGSGAAAYAVVGSATVLRTLHNQLDIATPAGNSFRVFNNSGSTIIQSTGITGYASFQAAAPSGQSAYYFGNVNSTEVGRITMSGSNAITFGTSSSASTQLAVAHTASAVNFVQVNGAATGNATRISTQGSDANVGMDLVLKGNPVGPGFRVQNQGGTGTCFAVLVSTASVVNHPRANPSAAGNPVSFSAEGSDTNIDLTLTPKGTGAVRNVTGGGLQLRVSDTASAVNFVQVTGAATGGTPSVTAQGSDANVGMSFSTKGSFNTSFRSGGGSWIQFVVNGANNSVNYLSAAGSVANQAPILSSVGNDTNISQVFQSKGTGAINLAPGSSGVNISNGGTVTAITRTAIGSGYTSVPSVAISAPTTAGGVQATATATMFIGTAPIAGGGTGYTVGNVLTISGGTGTAGTLTVTSVSAGVITAVSVAGGGSYSVTPANPVSVTGGTGSGATFNLTYGVNTAFTITNAGSGYVEQPTVSFSGGGGSGAAAYATVGGGAVIRGLGGISNTSLLFSTPGGPAFSVADSGRTTVDYWEAIGSSGNVGLRVAGATANNNGVITSKGTGFISLQTNAFGSEALRASHTASAVNFVQVTGAATGGIPTISAQGSDADIDIAITAKGNDSVRLSNGNGLAARFFGGINNLTLAGSGSGVAPAISVQGSDTNIDLALTPKGSGAVLANGPLQVDTNLVIDSFTATTTSTSANQVIASISATTFRTAKFLVQAVNATGNRFHTTEILTIHNGTLADSTEYASINIGGVCATFTVDLSGGSIRLLATPASANSTVFTVAVHSLK